ncbi:MAG: acyltransferase [Armatimonadetes bacterium]|nr:acyltransferase [Armatimonadota bacterium]
MQQDLWKTRLKRVAWLRATVRQTRAQQQSVYNRLAALRTALWLVLSRNRNVRVGAGARLIGRPLFRGKGIVELGDRVTLSSSWKDYHLALNRPVKLDALLESSRIIIGDETILHGTSIFAVGRVEIGKRCMLAGNIIVLDCNYHPLTPELRHCALSLESEPVVLEDNVWVGINSILLPGASVGKNSVIGAGSVVTRPVPPDCVAAGNPARVIKEL